MTKKAVQKNGDPLDLYFRIEISENNFGHKEHTLGIILNPNSGLGLLFFILRGAAGHALSSTGRRSQPFHQ